MVPVRLRLLLFLALRLLLRSRVSLALLVTAVTVGVAFQVPNSANLDGYTEELVRNGVVRAVGHVLLTPPDEERLEGVAATLARVRALPYVRAATARLLHAGVLMRKERRRPVRIVGVEPDAETRATGFCRRVEQGTCFAPDERDRIMLGANLADDLGVAVGDRLKLVIPYEELGDVVESSAFYFVSGILSGGGGFSEDEDVFLPIGRLHALFDEDDIASAILVFGRRFDEADEYARALATVLPNLRARPWWEANDFVANAIEGNRTVAAISMAMVIFAVMIPVLALLSIHVLHDRRQIAILGALGLGRAEVFAIYLLQAVIVGFVGAGLGAAAGVGLCAVFEAYPIYANGGFTVRPVLSAAGLLLPAGVLFAATVVAGVVPALRAARANPTDEIRED